MHDRSLLTPRRRLWPLFLVPAGVLVAAGGWTAFWFYAASQIDQKFDGWRMREAQSGRTYECANRTVGGYPFRLEVRCDNPQVTLVSQTAEQVASGVNLTAYLKDILVLAQIYDPTKIIAEFSGPAVVTQRNGSSIFSANWKTGRASVSGLPTAPQRVSIVFDNPVLDRSDGNQQSPIMKAGHVELHTRLLDGSLNSNPVIESALQMKAGSFQNLHPILAEPFDADIRAQLRGLKNFSPKPWPERFREIQAIGGRLDFTQSRIQQGETIAVAAGALELTPAGYLNGELKMTIAGIDKIVPMLGIDKLLDEGVQQSTVDRIAPGVNAQDVNRLLGTLDKVIPGLANVARKNANAGVVAGINLLGQPTTLEGKKAQAIPLKFVDGAVYIGPIKFAQTPPLF